MELGETMKVSVATGSITGIGVGPGDPEWITLKAYRALQDAHLIAYPKPENGASLARMLAATHFPPRVEELAISIPMVADRFPAAEIYDQAAAQILACAQKGQNIVILCEGDPFFYGSFMYLYQRLVPHHPVTVIPGVSSLTAAAAVAGFPLAERNEILSVLPAPLDDTLLREGLNLGNSFAIIKLGRHLPRIRALLKELSLEHHGRYVERVGMAEQRIWALDEVPDDYEAPYFSLLLVRKKVGP